MNYDSFLELVKTRRSIRRFKPDPVPQEYIDKIIEAARWAPSSSNTQPWEFVVIKDLELRKKILSFGAEYQQFSRVLNEANDSQRHRTGAPPAMDGNTIAPVFILLFGDTRTNQGEPKDLRLFPLTLQDIFTSSLAGANLYMHLAATTLGLTSEYASVSRLPIISYRIKTLLGIPEELEFHDLMMLGYPDGKPGTKLMRDGKMVHQDKCGKDEFRTNEEVLDFIIRSRAAFRANIAR